jgi:pantetheine-phosphate adenylyltransferase
MKVLLPGTFDAPHFGHFDIINYATNIGMDVTVGIANNSSKNTTLALMERERILSSNNVNTSIVGSMVHNHCSAFGFNAILKGVRKGDDSEIDAAHFNQSNGVSTVIVAPSGLPVSSTICKDVLYNGGDYTKLMPKISAQYLDCRRDVFKVLVGGQIGSGKSTVIKNIMNQLNKIGIESHHIDFDDITKEVKADQRYVNIPTVVDVTQIDWLTNQSHNIGSKFVPALLDLYNKKVKNLKGVIFIEGSNLISHNLHWLGCTAIYVECQYMTRKERYIQRCSDNGNDAYKKLDSDQLVGYLNKQDSVYDYLHVFGKELISIDHDDHKSTYEPDLEQAIYLDSNNTQIEQVTNELLNKIDVFGSLRISAINKNVLNATASIDGLVTWDVINLYNNKVNKFYHNSFHIAHGLKYLDITKGPPSENMAWILHDLEINEVKSVWRLNRTVYANSFKSQVFGLIKAMNWEDKNRTVASNYISERSVNYLRDIDFAYFAESKTEYSKVVKRIRKEYLHVSDIDFAIGRSQFLENLKIETDNQILKTVLKDKNEIALENIAIELDMYNNLKSTI